MAVGIYFFKFANNFTFGGITGLAVLVAKTGRISASDFTFIANMVLLAIGFVVLGKKFAEKTAYCSILFVCHLIRIGTAVSTEPAAYRSAGAGTGFCHRASFPWLCRAL